MFWINKKMSRKPIIDGGKRDEIISAAMELFFEKGYEETSIRGILDVVGKRDVIMKLISKLLEP
jgi:hypothetical protein